MEAKTYRVKSISEAIDKIRTELGPEASVLHTRRLPTGWWNWLSGHRYEVVASGDLRVPERFQQWLGESLDQTENWIQQELRQDEDDRLSDGADYETHPAERFPTASGNRLSSLVSPREESFEQFLGMEGGYRNHGNDDVEIPQADPRRWTSESRLDDPREDRQHRFGWEQLYAWLKSCDCNTETADLICNDLKTWYALAKQESPRNVICPEWDELVTLLGGQIRRGGTIQSRRGQCQRVAVVGPTGVGKTTTLAKLAGEYQLRRGWKVGMITVDTFRVGAVDQLKTYSQILKTPFEVVADEQQMREAVQSMNDLDLVLIDTIGRSPGDAPRIRQLQEILRAADLDQMYLTLSAASGPSALQRSYEGYRYLTSMTSSSLILTKVDECLSLASVYPFVKDCPMNWSYWTNGQEVPDDLGVTRDDVGVWFLDQIRTSLNG